MPNFPSEFKSPITSSKHKSVFLHQWWLIKVETESQLGVGGFVNNEPLGAFKRTSGSASTGKRRNINTIEYEVQVFCSAAISKRHDSNTLEAVDGIIIRINGCIDKSRTLSYGFSPEVRDVLMSNPDSPGLASIIFRDILKHTEKILDQSVSPIEKVCKNSTETEADHNEEDDISSLSNPNQKIMEEDSRIPVDIQLENSKESEDGGFMLDEAQKITRGEESKELRRRYPLRSMQKRKETHEVKI